VRENSEVVIKFTQMYIYIMIYIMGIFHRQYETWVCFKTQHAAYMYIHIDQWQVREK
jgi:hypothetical protein